MIVQCQWFHLRGVTVLYLHKKWVKANGHSHPAYEWVHEATEATNLPDNEARQLAAFYGGLVTSRS